LSGCHTAVVQEVDVVVIGAGVMGSAAAWRLAARGAEVALLERYQIGHAHGSSHGRSRIFRYSYPDPLYVRMAQQALPLWRQLEAETGNGLLMPTGGLDMGPDLDAHTAALDACGVAFERLSGTEVMTRFEGLRVAPDVPAIYQADGATIAAETTWRSLADAAVRAGADLQMGAPVVRLAVTGDRVDLDSAADSYRAKVAVVTAGGWSRDLLAGVGIDLPVVVTRETVAYFGMPKDLAVLPTLVEWTSPATYSLASPGQGLKVGQHRAALPVSPSGLDGPGEVSQQSLTYLSDWVASHYPVADPVPHHTETCLYTNAPGDHFIIERRGPIVIGSACSGHGFKFAPLIGQRLADLALSSTTP
jgi:sarcosine oxidase